MAELFFSYSHKDEALRDELEVHLAMLKRQGIIETYHDRRITSGSDLDASITEAMERADIILLLISPDFLNSDYCYDVEVEKAVQRHNAKLARVIPVILRPCEWQENTFFAGIMGAPTDNKPVTKWPDKDDAFLDITKRIRAVAKEMGVAPKPATNKAQAAPTSEKLTVTSLPRSSNLSVKKKFSDHDVDKFLDGAYEYIRQFFEGSLIELCDRNASLTYRLKDFDNASFTASVYDGGERKSVCSIFMGGMYSKGIGYVSQETTEKNSTNENLSVEKDNQKLFLKSSGMMSYMRAGTDKEEKLSFEGGAELFWDSFMRPLKDDNGW